MANNMGIRIIRSYVLGREILGRTLTAPRKCIGSEHKALVAIALALVRSHIEISVCWDKGVQNQSENPRDFDHRKLQHGWNIKNKKIEIREIKNIIMYLDISSRSQSRQTYFIFSRTKPGIFLFGPSCPWENKLCLAGLWFYCILIDLNK